MARAARPATPPRESVSACQRSLVPPCRQASGHHLVLTRASRRGAREPMIVARTRRHDGAVGAVADICGTAADAAGPAAARRPALPLPTPASTNVRTGALPRPMVLSVLRCPGECPRACHHGRRCRPYRPVAVAVWEQQSTCAQPVSTGIVSYIPCTTVRSGAARTPGSCTHDNVPGRRRTPRIIPSAGHRPRRCLGSCRGIRRRCRRT